jgi:hypothetical protein
VQIVRADSVITFTAVPVKPTGIEHADPLEQSLIGGATRLALQYVKYRPQGGTGESGAGEPEAVRCAADSEKFRVVAAESSVCASASRSSDPDQAQSAEQMMCLVTVGGRPVRYLLVRESNRW